jgi:hypothetical protein
MNTDRELIHAALAWSAAHARRLAIGKQKRQLDRKLKAESFAIFSPTREQQATAARQMTELKRRELAALRVLAKACAKQRGALDTSEVIDLVGAVVVLAGPSLLDVT